MPDMTIIERRVATVDADATLTMPIGLPTEPPAQLPASSSRPPPRRQHTPSFHTPLPRAGEVRATLTVLTGTEAGQLMAIDGTAVTIGRGEDADMVVDAVGVSRHHARISPTPSGGFCLEDLASTNGTFVGTTRVGVALLGRGDLIQLGPNLRLRFAIVDSAEEAVYRQLYESSVRDPLTHLFNRRFLADRLQTEIARARRTGADVSILMVDVDSLKTINDSFGHLAGDQALCAVASRVLRTLRAEDLLARYGGDEFVVLAVGADRAHARQLAERIRRAVEELLMMAQGGEVRITTSIGVASFSEFRPGDESVGTLLALADARMYGAKTSGKNKVCADDGGLEGP